MTTDLQEVDIARPLPLAASAQASDRSQRSRMRGRTQYSHATHHLFLAMIVVLALCQVCVAQEPAGPTTRLSDPRLPDDPSNPRVTPVVRAYQKARPAVVNISSQSEVLRGVSPFGGNDPFEDIFPSPMLRRVPVQSLGSGVIIHPSGYIVTNAHVVRGAQKITVTMQNGQSLGAEVISADADHDLAVLKIDPPGGKELPFLPLARSDDLMVGETVIAIGNPLGYANSVTTGVVSAIDRTLEFAQGVRYEGLIQTDAPINPGNSGGPLLNVNGELIGVNTAIRADAQNIGFAISSDAIADELLKLMDFERINRVLFGAGVAIRRGPGGVELEVSQVREGTPAAGQLEKGDRIIAIDQHSIRHVADFAYWMLGAKPDQTLRFEVQRGPERLTVAVTLLAKPRPDGKTLAQRLFGMTLGPITPDIARDNGLPVERGLVVLDIERGSPAQTIGLRPRDVIFQVDQLYVSDMDMLGLLLEETQAGQTRRIGVVRGNVAAWVGISARDAAAQPVTRASGQPRRPQVKKDAI